jgi:hypothetical protein
MVKIQNTVSTCHSIIQHAEKLGQQQWQSVLNNQSASHWCTRCDIYWQKKSPPLHDCLDNKRTVHFHLSLHTCSRDQLAVSIRCACCSDMSLKNMCYFLKVTLQGKILFKKSAAKSCKYIQNTCHWDTENPYYLPNLITWQNSCYKWFKIYKLYLPS